MKGNNFSARASQCDERLHPAYSREIQNALQPLDVKYYCVTGVYPPVVGGDAFRHV